MGILVTIAEPDLIVLNAPQARYDGFGEGSSVMEPKDVKKCYEFAKNAKIIPVHMNCFPHCICTIDMMKKLSNTLHLCHKT